MAHPFFFTLLVELFTSQGCSSCPPADRLLSELGGDPRVIALAFHVDYWDDLGWKDPFSSPAWSRRQGDYAGVLGRRGVYTPQLVVNGTAEAVGSDRARVHELIEGAAPPQVQLRFEGLSIEGGTLRARVAAVPAPGPDQALFLAVTEDGVVTQVARGENAGRRLANDHVVRRLVEVPPGGAATVPIDPGWDRKRLSAVVFVQNRRNLRILGATLARID